MADALAEAAGRSAFEIGIRAMERLRDLEPGTPAAENCVALPKLAFQ